MKKLKMWYIKLAFAALFFATIIGVQNVGARASRAVASVTLVQTQSASTRATLTSHAYAQSDENDKVKPRELAKAIEVENKRVSDEQQTQDASILRQISNLNTKKYSYMLVIPSLNIQAGVVNEGLTKEGKMAVPDNYIEVGWFSLGAKPGEVGSAVFGAHVDNGGSISGVFKNLKTLNSGDSVYVYAADGTLYHYVVEEKKVYNYQTKLTQDVFQTNDAARLNLVTCYGTWLPKQKTYDRRIVVSAVLHHTASKIISN